MTARRAAPGLALLVGATLLVAACGGATATTATTTPPVTQAPATTEPLSTNALPGFSFTLPSFTSVPDLEALFPDSIGGQTLTVTSMSGTAFLGTPAGSALAPIITQLGKSPGDLSVGFGATMSVTIIATKIQGVTAEQFLSAYTRSAQNAQGATITDVSFGGKSVKQVVTGGQVVYIYLSGDILWTVGGTTTTPTDALLNEAFSKLP